MDGIAVNVAVVVVVSQFTIEESHFYDSKSTCGPNAHCFQWPGTGKHI